MRASEKRKSPLKLPQRAYSSPGFSAAVENGEAIIITEGERNALAISQLGHPCIGLVGVWGWQKKRQRSDTGKAFGERKLICDLERVAWSGRNVVIVFDADVDSNERAQMAQARLAEVLKSHGAIVRVGRIPVDSGCKGIGEYLAQHDGRACQELERLIAEAQPAETPPPPSVIGWAKLFVAEHFTSATGCELFWHCDEYYRWTGTHYIPVSERELGAVVLSWLDKKRVDAKPRDAVDVVKGLASLCRLPFSIEAPCLERETGDYVQKTNWLPLENGVLDLDEVVLGRKHPSLIEHTPKFFSPFSLPYRHDANATCPNWFQTLNEIYGGDEELIDLVGEYFGYCLTWDTSLQKFVMFEGPPRSGKGTILRTLAAVVGEENCASPRLTSLVETFGLWSLLGKRVAICPDAHLGHGDKTMAILEIIKLITGEDAIDVQRKFLPTLRTRLRVRFALGVNELPRFGDDAGALRSRALIVPHRVSFEGNEKTTLEKMLWQERPGILVWALDGLMRLGANERFTQPRASEDVRRDYQRLVSPIAGFLEDCCLIGSELEVAKDVIYAKYTAWCEDNGRRPCAKETFGAKLRARLPKLADRRPRVAGERVRFYVGIGLREARP